MSLESAMSLKAVVLELRGFLFPLEDTRENEEKFQR